MGRYQPIVRVAVHHLGWDMNGVDIELLRHASRVSRAVSVGQAVRVAALFPVHLCFGIAGGFRSRGLVSRPVR